MSGTFGFSLANNNPFNDLPFQPILNDLLESTEKGGIPLVATNAEYFVRQNANQNIGIFDPSANLTSTDYSAHQSSFDFGHVQIQKKLFLTQIDLKSTLNNNLLQYRTPQGGYDKGAVQALCNFLGAALGKSYLNHVMTNLQSNIISQMTGFTTNYTTGLSGKIDWNLTDTTPPAGQTKILTYLNQYYAMFPPEMKWDGAIANYVTGYVSQNDFATMKNSLNSAYQFQPTGGFEQGKNVWDHSGQLSLKDIEIKNANSRNAHILFGNIVIRPLVQLADDTLLLTYQKTESKNLYYEQVPATNKQNLYFGIQGDFAYQPALLQPVAKDVETPYSLPLMAGRLFHSQPEPYNPLKHNLAFYMGSALVLQDPSRFFGLFPN